MWLEERFEDGLGPLSLLFSDQDVGKLSHFSEELFKEVAVSKGAEDKSEESESWWPARYIGTHL